MLFETGRLSIGRIAEDDAGFILTLLNDPGFLDNIGDRGVCTIEDARRYVAERIDAPWAAHGHGMLRVALRASGEAIGIVGFVRREGLAGPDLGFAFLARHTGRGYGREAAGALLARRPELRPMLAITTERNEASARLLRALGFVEEAPVALAGHAAPSRLFRLGDPAPSA